MLTIEVYDVYYAVDTPLIITLMVNTMILVFSVDEEVISQRNSCLMYIP